MPNGAFTVWHASRRDTPGIVRRVRSGVHQVTNGPAAGFCGVLALLSVLAATIGLGARGWLAGLACGTGLAVLLARAMARHGRDGLGPADRVTLARAVIVCGVAALAADAFGGRAAPLLVALAAVALVLDGVDGRVARRTGTASPFGARFDFEVDAFLILVLSMHVAGEWGWWVLILGLARYVYIAAGRVFPWLHGDPPPRRWARVVAVIVAVVLIVAASGILPDALTLPALLIALVLLAESFGRSVWVLWCQHGGRRFPVRAATAALACLLLWVALVVPHSVYDLAPRAFLRIPVEGLILVAILLMLPRPGARILALLCGIGLGVLTILRLLDMGFEVAFDTSFHPVYDTAHADSAFGLLRDSLGRAGAVAVLIGVVLLVVALLTVLPMAALRLTGLVDSHRRTSIRVLAALSAVAVAAGLSGAGAGPIASTASAQLAYTHATQIRDDLRNQREFVATLDQDPFRDTPAEDLLTGLRGKDVLIVFIESYGRTALDHDVVNTALDSGEQRLQQAGFAARSGFLTSSTYGGLSWLAHATLQSGVWVDNQSRYDQLVTLDRLTLAAAFSRAGWRTVADTPATLEDWPVGRTYYGYDQVYDAWNTGYAGPQFSYAPIPDQYTLAAFQRLELDRPDRAPVMAEIDLVSSHTPWAPLPRMVDWSLVGDGSIFDPMPAQGDAPEDVWRSAGLVRAAYAQSIAYCLDALTSFVQHVDDPDLVLVILGDHQPAGIVAGEGASHDVPVSIIAADPAVLDRAGDWAWQDGLRPGADAPVWPMDAFRDKFLTAFGPSPSDRR